MTCSALPSISAWLRDRLKSRLDCAIAARSRTAAARARSRSTAASSSPDTCTGRRAPAVSTRRVEPPPQQLGDLLAVQQPVGETEGGQLGADRVGVGERLAHHPAVRAQLALQWAAR